MKLMANALVLLTSMLVAAPALALEGNPKAGEKKAAACAACHGQGGKGASAAYPKLAGQGEAYTVKQLQDFKSGRRENPIMQAQARGLSEQDMADLAAYYAEQQVQVEAADPALVEAGERLYRGGNLTTDVSACAGCHGPAGEGIDAAAFPALGGQYADYVAAQLKAFRAAGRKDLEGSLRKNDAEGDTAGMMQSVAAKMSDSEIRAVASFISGLAPKR